MQLIRIFVPLFFISQSLFAQDIWSVSTFPAEAQFKSRTAGVIEQLADTPFGIRSLATSTCPDTGLPVRTWAVEGDSIISPYTGGKYGQGPTGYFGPKARNEKGEIIAFGGDPLKYDLQPATAFLLLNPEDEKAKAFLSIPGNMNQQYHFAAKNWARFYPLLSKNMGTGWIDDFTKAVGNYSEKRRPSDGPNREHNWLSHAHTLVGEPGHLLGGPKLDGGTENHKTMWRTTALLYSQLFPEGAKISGHSLAEAEEMTTIMITDYLKLCLQVGNGEYDSRIYYPHSIEAFLNLYDFSPKASTKLLAKTALDFYLATAGLKMIDGTMAGASKRGYFPGTEPDELESMSWAWGAETSRQMQNAEITLHQATTTYRPNLVLHNLMNKKVPLPFEAKIARPLYHMDSANRFQETFYASESFGLGSVAMTVVDNPTQQIVWSLIAKGTKGPLAFGGGHPRYLSANGHSPYQQNLQSKSSIIVMAGQTGKIPNEPDAYQQQRKQYASHNLVKITKPNMQDSISIAQFLEDSKTGAAAWFLVPKSVEVMEKQGKILIAANQTLIAVQPFAEYFWFDWQPPANVKAYRMLQTHKVLVMPGEKTGYVVEAVEKSEYGSLGAFAGEVLKNTTLDLNRLKKDAKVVYISLQNETIEMAYDHTRLRAQGQINGEALDYDNWANGGVYQSPYLTIKDGVMQVSDGEKGYTVDMKLNGINFREF
jgi:hypothetical protein